MESINNIISQLEEDNFVYLPKIFNLNHSDDKKAFTSLIQEKKVSSINDNVLGQIKELIKINNPSLTIGEFEFSKLIDEHLNGVDIQDYGVWVYYPWNNSLVHILNRNEFIKVRTNRNQYKITEEEQKILGKKKIGIAGLSVGNSIAITMATERICGEIRLADFDTIELSNLNRVKTSLKNLGIKKVIVSAREIAEIDPFIVVKIYKEGINKNNIYDFFTEDGNLDIVVEVCDSIDIKLEIRYVAKSLRTCVIMDTNDRGMIDIERFDIEPSREILHGLLGDFKINKNNISKEDKAHLINKILDIKNISKKLRSSMNEIGKSICAWPQLASSTTLGGAVTTDIARRIMLNTHTKSGRFYIDLDELLPS